MTAPSPWIPFFGGPCPLPRGTICDLMFDIGPAEMSVPVGEIDPDFPELTGASWTRAARTDPELHIIPWIIAFRVCASDPRRARYAEIFRIWADEATHAPAFVRRALITPPASHEALPGAREAEVNATMEELRVALLGWHQRLLAEAKAARDDTCRELAEEPSHGQRLVLHGRIRALTAAIAYNEAMITRAAHPEEAPRHE